MDRNRKKIVITNTSYLSFYTERVNMIYPTIRVDAHAKP